MTALAPVARAPLCVVLDIRHPLAYLALGPSLDLARELPVEVDWLPIEAPTLRPPPAPAAADDRAARHKIHRAAMMAREIAVYARARDLTVREPYRDGSPRAAHLAWLWVRSRAAARLPAFLEELFRRYWDLRLDAASGADATGVLRELGLDADGFERWAAGEADAEADRVAAAMRDAGVYQAPAYLVEDELFYGRQHLPMIRWILAGRSGPIPI